MSIGDRVTSEEVLACVRRVAGGTKPILGPEVERLEELVARDFSAWEAVATSSHTMAYALAFRAAGLVAGDPVVIPALGGRPAAAAARHLGLQARVVDVDGQGLAIPLDVVEGELAAGARSVVVAHLGADAPADEMCRQLVEAAGALVVEDGTLAVGSPFGGRLRPGWGVITVVGMPAWSPLAALGDGAFVVSSNAGVVAACRQLRNHGQEVALRGLHHRVGYNARMDELTAAVAALGFERRDDAEMVRTLDQYVASTGSSGPSARSAPRSVAFALHASRSDDLRARLLDANVAAKVLRPLDVARASAPPDDLVLLPLRDVAAPVTEAAARAVRHHLAELAGSRT